ncbi:hypothetical protein H072_6329 [Dactylellina haptotyla CBS 200.50]|uniref:Nephrocystin 3-like N-terminal domain-containing protein n=1 Tax=Dactylellina haptotyla (strain CBS 200.50) TaxID=1284197 RepID=S8BKL4_DACHA|nr:hypothetical protein H072_6329 [Dactylellina haptotyla CBS 200.50]
MITRKYCETFNSTFYLELLLLSILHQYLSEYRRDHINSSLRMSSSRITNIEEDSVVCVPLSVDAFVLNPALFASNRKSKICPLNLPDYTGLRYGSLLKADVIPPVHLHAASPVEVNTRITDVSGTGKPRADRMGVYLHWVLPRGFRTGIAASYSARDNYEKQRIDAGFPQKGENSENNGEPEFRPVPDRWFVFRYISESTSSIDGAASTEEQAPILRAFVIESNSIREIEEFGATEDVETEGAPFLDATKRTSEQGATYLGQKIDLEDWNPSSYGKHHSPLTVVSSSNALFADYQPHNANVFSLHDDLTYVGSDYNVTTLQSATVSYLIFGFYADMKEDPFYLDPGLEAVAKPLHTTILENCFMEVQNAGTEFATKWLKAEASESRLICHGAIHDVAWNLSEVPEKVPAEDIAQRFEDEHPIAIGTDVMDAVEAYLDSYQNTDGQGDDELANTMSDITSLIRRSKNDLHAYREEAKELFRNRFKPTVGGVVWRFGNREQDDGGSGKEGSKAPDPIGLPVKTDKAKPTDKEKKFIHDLNITQHYMDACVRHRNQLQFRLFCEWWKYRAEQETVFTGSMMRAEEREKRNRVTDIKREVLGLMWELRILGLGDISKNHKAGKLRKLKDEIKESSEDPLMKARMKATLQATFYARKDPAVVVIGVENPWSEDFSKANLKVRLSNQLPLMEKDKNALSFTKWTDIPSEQRGNIAGLQQFLEGLIQQNPECIKTLTSLPIPKKRWLEAWRRLHFEKLIDKAPIALAGTLKSLFTEWMFFTSNSYNDLYSLPEKPEFQYFRKPRPGAESQEITIKWKNTQGWFPLYIEWEAEYYHIPFDKWSLKKELDGTIIYAINERLNLSEVKGIKSDRRVVGGRSLLIPQVSETIENQVRRIFDNAKKDEEVLDEDTQKRILRDITRLPLLSTKLDGLTDHLLTLVGGAHVSPDGKDIEPPDVAYSTEGVFDADVIDYLTSATFEVTPYGKYLDFQHVRTESKERRFPFKPVTHGQVRLTKFNVIDKFGQVVPALPAERGREFIPLLPHTSKSLSCQSNSPVGPYFANSVIQDPEGQCQFIQLSPSINQDARINACFVMREEAKREENPDPKSINFWINRLFSDRQTSWRPCGEWDNPIWGWLLVNYRDSGLQIYEGDGTFRAEALLREDKVFWRPKGAATFLGDDDEDEGDDDDDDDRRAAATQLDFLLQRLKDSRYLHTLMELVKQALEVLSPIPGGFADQLPAILGRPLALVNTGWSLELATAPMVDQSYQLDKKNTGLQPTLLEYEFDLKIGDKNNSSDGVIGYFIENPRNDIKGEKDDTKVSKPNISDPYNMDYHSICTEFLDPILPPRAQKNPQHLTCVGSLPKMRPYYIPPTHHNPQDFRYLHDSMLQVFAMIIDPFSSITGYSGILPPKQLQLPPWTAEEAMKKMKPVIRVGPVLIPGDVPAMSEMQIATLGQSATVPATQPITAPGQTQEGTEATPGIPAHVPSDGDWIWLQPKAVGTESDEVEYVEIPLTQYQTGYIPMEGPHTAIEGFLQLKSIAGEKTSPRRSSHLRRSLGRTIDIPIIPNGSIGSPSAFPRHLNGYTPYSPTSPSSSSTSSKSFFQIAVRTSIQTTPKIAEHLDKCRTLINRFRVAVASDTECERILKGCLHFAAFKKFIDAQRIRDMPAEGSVWDNTLRWALYFGEELGTFARLTVSFFPGSEQIAENIWGCCKALLLIGARYVTALQRFFDELYYIAVALETIESNKDIFASSTELQEVASAILAVLLELAIVVIIHYKQNKTITARTIEECDVLINPIVNDFKRRKNSLELSIWLYRLRSSPEVPGTGAISLTTLKGWLSSKVPSTSQVLPCEGTCTWFEETLTDFKEGSDQLLMVYGEPGCGKSVLSSWIIHRLRMHRDDILIHHALDKTVGSGASSQTIARSLTLQLLNKRVGDVDLYKRLTDLYTASTANPDAYSEVEMGNALWQIFEETAVSSKQLNLVIDGLDAIDGGNPEAEKLMQRFKSIIDRNGLNSLNCVILSRHIRPKLTIKVKEFVISDTQTKYDIRCFVSKFIYDYPGFASLTEKEKRDIIDRVVAKSDGSFLAANLLLQTITRYGTLADILKILGSSIPDGVPGLLEILLKGIDLKSANVQKIIYWLLVTQQPLSLVDLKELLEIRTEPQKRPQFAPRLAWDVEKHIIQPCGSLVAVEGAVVRFTHPSLKEHLLRKLKATDFGVTLEQCHSEVFGDMMSYIEACNLPTGNDTDFGPVDGSMFRDSVQKHGLLLYCINYWVLHFKLSTYWKNDKVVMSKDLIDLFPTTIAFPRLEGLIGTREAFPESMFLDFAQIRNTIIGNMAPTVHALMNLSRYKLSVGNLEGSTSGIYECWKLSRRCFGAQSLQTRNLARLYAQAISKTGWLDTSEEVYKWVWSFHNDTKTPIDQEVVEMMKLYIRKLKEKEPKEATRLYRELWKSCGSTFGEFHIITTEILELLIESLGTTEGDVDEYLEICIGHLSMYEKTLKPWDDLLLGAVIRLSHAYERKSDILSAGKTLVDAMDKLKTSRPTATGEEMIKIHIAWIRLHVELKKLQLNHNTKGELVGTLKTFWIEIKSFVINLRNNIDLNSLISHLVLLAVLFEEIGLLKEAEELYEALWGLFKRFPDLFGHPDVLKVGGCLAGLRGKTNPGSEEDLLKEILDLSRTKGAVTQQELDAYIRLSIFYKDHQAWQKLLDICKQGLQRLWPEVLLPKVEKIYLPKEHSSAALQLGYQLATAYVEMGSKDSAETIYCRIFGACRNSLMSGEDEVLTALIAYCDFLEAVGKSQEAIKVFSDAFERLRNSLSPRDERKISVGLRLAGLLVRTGDLTKAETIFLQLWTALSAGKLTSQLFQIASKLSELYSKNPSFKNAENFYQSFFTCIFAVNEQIDFTADPEIVFDVYQRLVAILKPRDGSAADIKILTDKLKQFYLVNFGDHHMSYFQILYLLAIILEEEGTTGAAIAQYKWLLNAFKDVMQQKILQYMTIDIKKRLAGLLSRTKEGAKEAEDLYRELWVLCKHDHGAANVSSMELLKLLIQFLKSQDRVKDAILTLEVTIIEILSEEEHSHTLYESATKVADLYISLDSSDNGFRFSMAVRKFFLQFSIDRCKPDNPQFKDLEVRSVNGFITDRSYQIFLSTIESILYEPKAKTKVRDIFLILQDVLKETDLYEVWLRSSKRGESLDMVLSAGSRLRTFLLDHHRKDESEYIYSEMWKYFESDYTVFINRNRKPTMKDYPVKELQAFFARCLDYCLQEDQTRDSKLILAGTNQVEVYLGVGDINPAFTIAIWTYSWIETDGKFANVFKLLFLLTSSNVKACPDEGLRDTIKSFTQEILRNLLSRDSGIGVSWTSMSIEELNRLLILLGGEKSWEFMLTIIQYLWDQRSEHDDTWTPDLVTAIGRRLCDTYMVLNQKDNALRLCERIYYNYRRVFGELNPETLSFADLLAQLYTSASQYSKAMILNERVLQALANPSNKSQIKGREIEIIFRQLTLLKYSRSMTGSWQSPEENYTNLISQLHTLYQQKHSRWDEIADFSLWSTRSVETSDGPCLWQPPALWNILEDDSITWKGGVPSIVETPKSPPVVRSPKRFSRTSTISEMESMKKESDFEVFSRSPFARLFSG